MVHCKLTQLQSLLRCWYSGMEVTGAIAPDTPAYDAAVSLNIPLIEFTTSVEPELRKSASDQPELFQPKTKTAAFIDDCEFNSKMPFAFGGDPIEQDDEYNNLVAYDCDNVLFYCPRGLCIIQRDKWLNGIRFCGGC